MKTGDVEQAVADELRAMTLEMPFNKIKVLDLCQRSGVSRKTFYAHFASKEDVLARIIRKDTVEAPRQLHAAFRRDQAEISSKLLIEMIYQGILNEAEFYKNLAKPANAATFSHIMANTFRTLHQELVGPDSQQDEQLLCASYYGAAGQTSVVLHWIEGGMKTSPEQMAEWTSDWGMHAAVVGF